jgi:hypothetical protein
MPGPVQTDSSNRPSITICSDVRRAMMILVADESGEEAKRLPLRRTTDVKESA